MGRHRMFQDRTRLVVYMETADLQRITETAREAGKTVVEWAREVLLEIGEPKAMRGNKSLCVVKRWVVPNRDSGGAGTVQATRAGRNAENSLGTPGSDEFVPPTGVAASTGEPEVATKPSGKTCKHKIAKGWRCWQCGGLAVIE